MTDVMDRLREGLSSGGTSVGLKNERRELAPIVGDCAERESHMAIYDLDQTELRSLLTPNIDPAVRCVLIAAPCHGRCR